MQRMLRLIIQAVNAANNLEESLDIMVHKISKAVNASSCSIYLIDNQRAEFLLMATSGLNPKAVGKLRIHVDQGLIGLVGRREEPINLENAKQHPSFVPSEFAGEDHYHAFLGTPIIHHRRLLGIITLQNEDSRAFDETEEAFLITLAVQLASIIANAEATGAISELSAQALEKPGYEEAAITGQPAVAGVGLGTAVVVYPPADLSAVPEKTTDDIPGEIERLHQALNETSREITMMRDRMQNTLPEEELALFDAYLGILASENLAKEIIEHIEAGIWAQTALRRVIKRHVNHFEAISDDYLRERASDFRDLGRRVLANLQSQEPRRVDYPENTILVGDDVTASALAEVPEGCLKGVVSGQGSKNAHVAILARALGVPTVTGGQGMQLTQLEGQSLIVDGYFGQAYVNPSPELHREFAELAAEERELDEGLEALRDQAAETPDGHKIAMYVNAGMVADAGLTLSVGAEGVGLYRTEVTFMARDRFPSEDEQAVIYRQILKAFAPQPVTLRTLDVGGDKHLPYLPIEEANPFLGWRGLRITLDHPEVFLIQVRAMLRANRDIGNLSIMLPMVSGVGELTEAIHLMEQAYDELSEELDNIIMPRIGVMIEIPSAVYQARDLAKKVDFLSVGSNDLTQYLLAVDRTNPRVAQLYDPLHPAVLKALMQVVEGGHAEGKNVGICGEMASDPVAVIVLLAMGFDTVSLNPASLPRMKWVVRNFTVARARKLLSEVLEMDNPTLIRFHLEKALDDVGLGGLIRAGKH